jgi:hypothetical protein
VLQNRLIGTASAIEPPSGVLAIKNDLLSKMIYYRQLQSFPHDGAAPTSRGVAVQQTRLRNLANRLLFYGSSFRLFLIYNRNIA